MVIGIIDGFLPYLDARAITGIPIQLISSDRECGAVVQRAPDTPSGPGTFVTIFSVSYRAFDATGKYETLDPVPLDGTPRWYRWKHARIGHIDSEYTKPQKAFAREVQGALGEDDGSGGGTGGGGGGGGIEDDTTYLLNVQSFGARGDVIILNGIDAISGSLQLSSSNAPFAFTDVSKSIAIQGAGPGGGTLLSIIAAVTNSATISIADIPQTSAVNATFMFGSDNHSVIQGVMELAAEQTQSIRSQVFIPNGAYLVGVDDDSLGIESGISIFGDGPATRLIAFGGNTGPILATSGSGVKNFGIRDLTLDGARDFHTGSQTVGLLISESQDFSISGITVESASLDAISIDGCTAGQISNISTKDVGNGIRAANSDNLTITNVQDSGSSGYGILLDNVQDSSIGPIALDEGGSGSVVEASGSSGNTILGKFPFLDFQIPKPINNPTGSWVQFIEGGPLNPGFGAVQGALFANYSGTLDDNWIGLVGKVTLSEDLTPVAELPVIWSASLGTKHISFAGGASFEGTVTASTMFGTSSQATSASFAETASFALNAAVGGFDGTGSILIPSLSFGLNEGIDLGNQNTPFTISFHDGNEQRFTPTDDIAFTIESLNVGGIILVGINNAGSYSIGLPTANWHGGNAATVPTGKSLYGFVQFDASTLIGYIVGENVALSGGPGPAFTGSFNIPSGSTAIHEIVDVGIQSSSLTMSMDGAQIQKITPGADITIYFDKLGLGQLNEIAIDNGGSHSITLNPVVWHGGAAIPVSTGSNLMTIQNTPFGLLAGFIAQDIS
ncbi:hypothetical protein LCGC14_0718150 [marine sediment metagenome]|uniref:Uncharacterized protein n=1 Tax=marine sediment metagenome TaxID=412755 RepID=A0A0F9TKM1_9ZZZZ